MNIRTFTGITAALIAVCALTAAAMFPATRLISLPASVFSLLLASSLLSAAGRFSTLSADLKGHSVSVQLWGVSPAGDASTVFRVQSIRAIGAGLNIWLESPSGGKPTHLKVAQPKGVSRTAAEYRIVDAAYVQWAGRKMPRHEGAAAVLLNAAEPTALPAASTLKRDTE